MAPRNVHPPDSSTMQSSIPAKKLSGRCSFQNAIEFFVVCVIAGTAAIQFQVIQSGQKGQGSTMFFHWYTTTTTNPFFKYFFKKRRIIIDSEKSDKRRSPTLEI